MDWIEWNKVPPPESTLQVSVQADMRCRTETGGNLHRGIFCGGGELGATRCLWVGRCCQCEQCARTGSRAPFHSTAFLMSQHDCA